MCVRACDCMHAHAYGECWLYYRGQKRRDEHLQAAIMGNFPTAAELKLPKTKQRGKIYSLVESMRWGGEGGGMRERGGRERVSDVHHFYAFFNFLRSFLYQEATLLLFIVIYLLFTHLNPD